MPTLDEAIDTIQPAKSDPLDSAIDSAASDANDRRRTSIYGAVKTNPDQYGQAVQMSRATGVPAQVVSRNLDDVKHRLQLDTIDASVNSGSTLGRKLEDPDFANIAHDDTPNLTALESAVGEVSAPGLRPTPRPTPTFGNYLSGLWSSVSQSAQQTNLGMQMQAADLFKDDSIGGEIHRADLARKYDQATSRLEGSTPGFESSTASGIYSGFSSLLQQAPGVAASVLTGSPIPALAQAGGQVEAQSYGKYRARGATPGEALVGGVGEGAVEVGTEMLPMGFLVSKFGKVGAGQFLAGLLAREVPGEQVATLAQDAIDTAVANPNKTWGEYLAERPDAAYQTLLATLVQSGVMEGGHVALHKATEQGAKADQAVQDAQALDSVRNLSASSKVRPRDVQSFEDFVQSANEGGPVQDIYIDSQALKQSGIDPAALAAVSPTAAAQLQEAIATGGDLVIPVSEYAGRIAGTDHDTALAPHLRTSEDALSLDEAQRYFQTQGEEMRTAASQVMEEKATDDAFQTSAKEVETKLFDQLQATGRFTPDVNTAYSTLMRDFYVTTASRLGITPTEMYARYPLEVRAESVTSDARMGQEGDRESRKIEIPSMFGDGTATVLKNPTREQAAGFANNAKHQSLRGIVDPETGDLYLADSHKVDHKMLTEALGLDWGKVRDSVDEETGSSNRLNIPAKAVGGYPRNIFKGDVANAKDSGYTADNKLSQGGTNDRQAGTNRPGLQANQEPRTVGGGAPRVGWAESTRVRTNAGKPATVYRGASQPLAAIDFATGSLGRATGHPSSGLGVWLTLDRSDAAKYGNVESFQLDIRKPKVYRDADIPAFDSVEEAQAFARDLQAQGYDGIAVDYRGLGGPLQFVAFTPETVIKPAAPKSLDMSQFFQGDKDLIIQHSLSAENLLNAMKVGGLAVPSLAITRADSALTGFGDITLLGDANTATPGGDTKVFGADIYSPRYPSVEHTFDKFALKRLNAKLSPFAEGREIYSGEISRADDLVSNKAFQRYAADKLGESDPKGVGYHDLLGVANGLLTEVGSEERIFQGYTNSGNRRYIPHTLDNVVKILKKELRGGENFNYGVGSVRAHHTPQFRSLNAIRKEKGRLTSRENFDKVKEEINKEFFEVADSLRSFHEASNSFGYSDAVALMMGDAAKMGIPRALKENGFQDVTPEAMEGVRDYLDKLRDLPTEYFEAKITRAVDIGEFKAAVVPDDVKPEARAALEKAGVHTYEYKSGDETARREAVTKAADERGLLFQNDQGGNRGEISFGKDISQSPSVITLFKNADLSTALHELGHFQLEVLANIASRPDAPQGVADDMDAALNWFKPGMTLDDWNGMDMEDKRPYHEQFARGFEAYLFDGNAPNAELQSLFQRFRAWLVNVYKSVKALNVEISPELRGVFDRLLATDETIKAAESMRAMAPLFTTPEEMGDTPEAFTEYQRLGLEAGRDAQDELGKRSLKDMQWLTNARGRVLKQLQRDAKEKRAAVESEVRAEVEAQPVYAVQRFLKYGELADTDRTNAERKVLDSLAGQPTKLSLPMLKEIYGDGPAAPWRYLSTGKAGLAATEGVHPDVIAELFGYQSGDQMVREILAAQPINEVVEGMTDQRVLERYGDITSPDTLAKAADAAIHNDARAKFVGTELKALTKAQGPVRAMTKAAKAFAETIIARKKIKDIKPNQFAAAETRAAKNAEKALKAGDSVTAGNEKRNQLIQNYATRAAYDAVSEIEKSVSYLKKFDSEGVRKNIDSGYTDQIDTLLERFDLRTSVSNKAAAKRESLLQWVEKQREQGLEPEVPPELLSEAMRKPYREMTLEELRGLVDTVKQIEHLGRLKQKLLTAKDQREFAVATAEISQSIAENAQGRTAETRTPTDSLGKLAAQLKRFWASHIKAATWSRVMDGGKDGGPMWEYFIRTANEKGDGETQMRADATLALSKILSPVVESWPKMQGKGAYYPSVGRAFTREGAMTVALNTGNEGNLQRLLGGEGWTITQIAPVLQSLTAQEWQAVQAIWDHFESYRPQIAAKEKRIYGKEPNWVEPVPFTVRSADGQEVNLKGGYYPIKYDAAASQRAEEHADADQAKRDMKGAYTAATTRRSFTKTRAEEVTGRPLLYSLVGVYSGVNDVIHDLSWHEWLIDANRLLRNRSIDQAIRGHYGPEVKAQFKQWVKDIAQGESRADNPAEVGVAWLRQGVSAAGMGFNVMSAVMQVTGLSQSIVRVGTGYMGRGIAQYVASPVGKTREVVGRSAFMADRNRTQFRELNELRNQVEGQSKAGKFLTFGTYFLMMRAQQMVDVPTWLGAYEKAIAEGNNEDRSSALADQAVIDAQGSGMVKDLSTVERGGQAMKLFTVFYSFMNTALNVGVQVGMTERSKAKLAAKMLMIYTVPAVLGYALKSAIVPSAGGGDDDPEKLARKLAAEQLSYLTGLFVGVREFSELGRIVAGVEGTRDYAGPAGARVVGDAFKFGKQAMQGDFDDAFRKASINLLGDLTGLPSAQINRTINGAEALSEGQTANPAALVLGVQK